MLYFLKALDYFTIFLCMDIYLQKSKIFFFNTPPDIQCHLTNLLGFKKITLPTTYLGTPLAPNFPCTKVFSSLIQKLTNLMDRWTIYSLDIFEKNILLKYVLHALPMYLLSTSEAHKRILDKIKFL